MNLSNKSLAAVMIFLLFGTSGAGLLPDVWPQKEPVDSKVNSTQGCATNPDPLYKREEIFEQFSKSYNEILKTSHIENEVKEAIVKGLFVFDLTDPSNNSRINTATGESNNNQCVNFIEGHVYHFSASVFQFSFSQIAVLENGKVRIFKSINCNDSADKLEDVVAYLDKKRIGNKNKDEILTRVKNYRRYGVYIAFGFPRLEGCQPIPYTSENSDDRYDTTKILRHFNDILEKEVPALLKYRPSFMAVLRQQAIGFFVHDLTDPSNKQTSLLERVNFINDHVYHFAYIDAPYSFSNIAVLHNGEVKIFKAINCKNSGDEVKDVIKYMNKILTDNQNKKETIERMKNYRKFGVYAPLNGMSMPQCEL